MNWIKRSFVYHVSGKNGFDYSHCHKPMPLIIDEKTVRVFFGVRDKSNKTRTTFIDLDIKNLKRIKYIHEKPVLDLGKIGAFDDSGVNVPSICRHNEWVYMYYIGWNPSTTVPTRNSIGIAVSKDNGTSFERLFDGPILDRNKEEPYYTGAVDVIKSKDKWEMWYTSGTEWKIINSRPKIHYHIKYAFSENGIDWIRNNTSCIKPENEYEATARPSVLKENNLFKMWYSRRSIVNFRDGKNNGYRAGYAESLNGQDWIRKDKQVGIDISDGGWDSEAIAYPYVLKINDQLIMFYNGNGFGKTGFGFAVYNE